MEPKPLSNQNLVRLLVGVIIVLAFIAGYYHSQIYTYEKKLKKLQVRYDTLARQVQDRVE